MRAHTQSVGERTNAGQGGLRLGAVPDNLNFIALVADTALGTSSHDSSTAGDRVSVL